MHIYCGITIKICYPDNLKKKTDLPVGGYFQNIDLLSLLII